MKLKEYGIKNKILLISFVLILIMCVININRIPNKEATLEKRYLAGFPDLFDANGKFISEGFTDGVEDWIDDNIGFRDFWVKLHANISFKLFKIIPTDKVQAGKDDWYFYKMDDNLKIAEGTYPLSDEDCNSIVAKQQRLKDYFESKGIEYALILPPSKASIYPEKIGSEYKVIDTPDDIIESKLKSNSDVNVINLKPALLNAKSENQQLYFKDDTHWNETGAYIGYETIWNYLHNIGLVNSDCPKVTWEEATHLGEFGAMMGDLNILGTEKTLNSVLVNPQAYQVNDGDLYNSVISLRDKYGYPGMYVFQNDSPTADDKTVLLFGDSMFAQWNIPQLFAENYKTFVYIWSYSINKDTIEAVNPDIVLYDCGERYTKNVLTEDKTDFLFKVLNAPSAQIVDENIKNSINNKEACYVTVKNTGTETWSEDDAVRLCIKFDGSDTGCRIRMPEGVTVAPGESYKFTIEELSNYPEKYNEIECCMVQEGVQYFGDNYIAK